MRLTVAALIAVAAVATVSTPAAACGFFSCFNEALADDAYPPGVSPLDPAVQEAVRARVGFGLSAAGFYNDPTLAMAHRNYDRPVYGVHYDAPPPAYEAPAPDTVVEVDYAEHQRRRDPHVIASPYSRPHREHAERDGEHRRTY